VAAIDKLLDDLLDRPRYLNERQLLGLLFQKLLDTDGFNQLLDTRLAGMPITLTLRGADPMDLPLEALQRALDQISTLTDDASSVGKSIYDVVATLRISMKPTITDVADHVLEQLDQDDAIVALMMDIRAPDEGARDRENFLRQIAGTEEAALQRPGRVLPFFAVHPERPDCLALLKQAVEKRGFVGVKLYPSLGYSIDHPTLLEVYDYCLEMDLPVVLHCSHGGFYRKAEYIDYCDPGDWEAVLTGDRAGLRVCFAHFGGWQALGEPDGLDPGTWGRTILDLIQTRPNVFTDLAYHTSQMGDPAAEAHYFSKLAELLADDLLKRRILYGSDTWLLRLDLANTYFRSYFEERMTEAEFRQISEIAPMEFLGFPRPGRAMRPNLQRYVAAVDARRSKLGAEPAKWLRNRLSGSLTVDRAPASWSIRKDAPARTWQGLANVMTNSQRQKFLTARLIQLSDLTYFQPRDPNFHHKCQHLALTFVQFAGQGGAYRGRWDDTSAVNHFTELFRKGEDTLGEVALVLDSVFEYGKPLA
jgi:predicted TIM-barrel fold metal-dependent hydrolase